jgi:hypothetical protein
MPVPLYFWYSEHMIDRMRFVVCQICFPSLRGNDFLLKLVHMMDIRGQSIKKPNFFFNLLLYLQLNQTCLPQSTPLHSWYTAPNVFSSSGTRPGTCFAGWREGRSLIGFSSISSTVWNRLYKKKHFPYVILYLGLF